MRNDIQVLPPEVASQIAAGEVVERPASVVKELVENALDAGATDIRVEVREGGQRLVRVSDNGHGIPAGQVALAFARHATSKLRSADDLERIVTLGFRGEALASMAAVAQVTLLTRTADEEAGTLAKVAGATPPRLEPHAAPQGTVVTVENLFFNLPARRKFLRATGTENRHIQDVVTHYALACPACRLALVSDGKLLFHSTGSGKRSDVLVKLLGLESAKQMLEVQGEEWAGGDAQGAVRVTGFVGEPSLHRANRNQISLFVNQRWVQDRNLAYAIVQAYHTFLPVGRYPVAYVLVEVDPATVDVNVHPTKAEIRFQDASSVFRVVQKAVRRTLVDHAPVAEASPALATARPVDRWQLLTHAGPRATQLAMEMQRPAPGPLPRPARPTNGGPDAGLEAAPEPAIEAPAATRELPPLRVLGQLAQTYIIAEGPEGMYLIDQHAAHERVLFDRLMAERAAHTVASQTLLEPVTVELTLAQAAAMAEMAGALGDVGFVVEPFGGPTWLVRAVPAVLAHLDPARAVRDVLDGRAEDDDAVGLAVEERLIRFICKQATVKAGRTLSLAEMQALIEALEASPSPRTCPHGRPTMLHVSAAQLAQEFHRH